MSTLSPKVFLFVGTAGCGKTALARRILENVWVERPTPTIGLDDQLGSLCVQQDGDRFRDDLHVMLTESGVELQFWEIGGKDCKHRSAPRGKLIHGLVLCYDVGNRSSFQTAAHLLLQHRADRHREYESASVKARDCDPPQLAVILCGTKADAADESGGHMVTTSEQLSFVERSGLSGAFVTSAKTGEGVEEAFQALLLASLEAEEEADIKRMQTTLSPRAGEMFSLTSPKAALSPNGTRDLKAMTSPRGLRPHEPSRGVAAAPVVEIIDQEGSPYGARPLSTCLEIGLMHRAVHAWLCDPRSGGLLLRRYSQLAAKEPGYWGPSARGEVLSYHTEPIGADRGSKGPQSAELSFDTARRVLKEQLGFQKDGLAHIEHWGSCASHHGKMHELIEIYVVDIGLNGLPDLQLRSDEGVEWAHFTDVFGIEGKKSNKLFHIENTYRAFMVQKMQKRVEHAHRENGLGSADIFQGHLDN